jgi:hypothetical protein
MGLDKYASYFADKGLAAFVFDYRTFGGSSGEPRNWVSPRRHLADWRSAIKHVQVSTGRGGHGRLSLIVARGAWWLLACACPAPTCRLGADAAAVPRQLPPHPALAAAACRRPAWTAK